MVVIDKQLVLMEHCYDHGYGLYYNQKYESYRISPARLRSEGCVFCEEIFVLHSDLMNMHRLTLGYYNVSAV